MKVISAYRQAAIGSRRTNFISDRFEEIKIFVNWTAAHLPKRQSLQGRHFTNKRLHILNENFVGCAEIADEWDFSKWNSFWGCITMQPACGLFTQSLAAIIKATRHRFIDSPPDWDYRHWKTEDNWPRKRENYIYLLILRTHDSHLPVVTWRLNLLSSITCTENRDSLWVFIATSQLKTKLSKNKFNLPN